METSYENINGKLKITGRQHKLEIDSFIVDKVIYRPTKERFLKFCNIISKKEWFNKYEFIITGSFVNILNDNSLWDTWDVDIILYDNIKIKNYKEIKLVLQECTRIALSECDFFLDIYYANHDSLWVKGDYHTSNYREKITRKNYKNYLNKFKKEVIQSYKVMKRDNIVCNKTQIITEEIIEGLWKRNSFFPSFKQLLREIAKLKYDSPINLKNYLKNFKK